MKIGRSTINTNTIIWGLLLFLLLVPGIFWFFGPMNYSEHQCLLCHRVRVKKSKCGFQLYDTVKPNKYSDWIDTFYSKHHKHIWAQSTSKSRSWFGGTAIGCGGIATIPRIYEQRKKIGRRNAIKLVQKYHQFVTKPAQPSYQKMRSFTKNVQQDPAKLLEN